MKRILTSFIFLLLSAASFAYDAYIDGIYYYFLGTEATVTCLTTFSDNVNAYKGSVVVPETVTYNGTTYSVTSIGESAFSYCSSLTSVTIPNSVTTIEDDAFFVCSGLTSVTIPNSVTGIGNSAFRSCSGLTSITIPNSVTSIGNSAFRNCSGLTSVTIPNSVTSIGSAAFSGCSGLTSVTIPNSMTSIGEYNQEIEGVTNVEVIPVSA